MKLYCGIDLHSNNVVVRVIDKNDRTLYQKKLPCELDVILMALKPHKKSIDGIAIESTLCGIG